MSVTIREYRGSDDKGLLEVFNASRFDWPSVWEPSRLEDVIRQNREYTNLAAFVAEVDGQIAGYSTLIDHEEKKDYTIVGSLVVHPNFRGKGVGTRLIEACINRSRELGRKVVTLGTWHENKPALRVYRKTGFIWMPESNVWMENYRLLPERISYIKAFLDVHPQYKLEAKQEKLSFHGKEAYEVDFLDTASEDWVKVYVDREAAEVMGFECKWGKEIVESYIESDRHQLVPESEARMKIFYKTNVKPPSVVIMEVKKPDGLELTPTKGVSPRFLQPEEPMPFFTEYVLKIPEKAEAKLYTLEGSVIFSGHVVPLRVGLNVKKSIEVSLNPSRIIDACNSTQDLKISIKNNTASTQEGKATITLFDSDIKAEPAEFSYGPLEPSTKDLDIYANLTTKIRLPKKPSLVSGEVIATYKNPAGLEKSVKQPFSVESLEAGNLVARVEGDKIFVEHLNYRVTIDLNMGGRIGEIYLKPSNHNYNMPFFEDRIGPPYWPYEFVNKKPECQILQQSGREVKIRTRITSTRVPNIRVEKTLTIRGEDPLVQMELSFTNLGTQPKKFTLNLGCYGRAGGEVSGFTRFYLPTREGILDASIVNPRIWPREFRISANKLSDGWCSWQNEEVREVAGLVWPLNQITKYRCGTWIDNSTIGELIFKEISLPSGRTVRVGPALLCVGYGDWRKVRSLYEAYQGVHVEERKERFVKPIEVDIESPRKIASLKEMEAFTVRVKNNTMAGLKGYVKLVAPKKWRVKRSLRKVRSLGAGKEARYTFEVKAPEKEKGGVKRFHILTDLNGEEVARERSILMAGKAATSVVETSLADKRGVVLQNEYVKATVLPSFGGRITSLISRDNGHEHVYWKYPDPKIMPNGLPDFGITDLIYEKAGPGLNIAKGDWKHEIDEKKGSVKLTYVSKEDPKGLQVEKTVSLIPGTPILKVEFRLVNLRTHERTPSWTVKADLNVGGSKEENHLYIPTSEGIMGKGFFPGDRLQEFIGVTEGWVAAVNKAEKEVVGFIFNRRDFPWLELWHDPDYMGIYLRRAVNPKLKSEGQWQTTMYIALEKGTHEKIAELARVLQPKPGHSI